MTTCCAVPTVCGDTMTDMQHPLFSIITVTYNAAATLPVTLESVKAQNYTRYESIVVDGASTDNTVALARSSGVAGLRVVSEADHGIYDAMNRGLDMACGDYVIFLNAGDALHSPDTLARYAQAIMDNSYPGIVYGQTRLVDSCRRRLGDRHLRAPELLTLRSFADGMVVCHQAMAVLKRITSEYDLKYRYSADYEWVIRCLQHSRHNVYVPDVVVDYLSEGVTTANRTASLRERFRIMAYYYGWWPTVLRHLRFIPRYFAHKRRMRRAESSIDQ